MLRVTVIMALLTVAMPALSADPLDACNVVWKSPSLDSNGSMPIGNGDIGLNVWVEEGGDLLFYISKTDAWDEHCRLLKLGRVRVTLTPNPFAKGRPFRQELRLRQGEIAVTALTEPGAAGDGSTRLRVWVDANRPVIHVEMDSGSPVSVAASLEVWRTEKRPLQSGEDAGVDGFAANEPPHSFPDTVRPDPKTAITWYHRNQASLWPVTLRHQGLAELIATQKDPLLNRTFGGQMCLYPKTGRVEKPTERSLRTTEPVKGARLSITCLTAQTATEEEWLAKLARVRHDAEAVSPASARDEHARWWDAFWNRSWVRVTASRGGGRGAPMRRNTLPLRIGADSDGQNRFQGLIAQVSLYKRARTAAEIADAARGGAWRSGILGRWPMGVLRDGIVPSYGPPGPPMKAVGKLVVEPIAPWPDGHSARFDGSAYLETPHTADLDLTDAVTIEAWVKPGKLPPGGARILDKTHAGNEDGYLLDTYSGNSLRLIVADGVLTYDAKLPTDTFTHVAGVYDARTGRKELYVNGKRVAAGRGGPDGRPEHLVVTQGYALQRFITACAGRGAYPIKFNGSIFTVDTDRRFDPDYRAWGGMYWFQNTRLPYWPMLASGDYDTMLPLYRMFRASLDLATHRTAKYFRHGGAFYPETMYFWGAYNNGGMGYGWDRRGKALFPGDNEYIRYHWSGALELTAMMLDHWLHTQDRKLLRDTLLPLADAVLAFFDQHYPRDASGKLRFEPSQSLETWWDCVNPLPEIAGLHFVLEELVQLPARDVGAVRMAAWKRLRGSLPAVPTKTVQGKRLLAPAEKVGRKSNMENPELYAIFPFRLFGVGKPDLAVARDTFARRLHPGNRGWQQDDTQAAYLGLTDEARRAVADRFATKHDASRFPAFWGPNFDWVPDQDHGANGVMGLQTMLMQCEGRRILLFPAWPKEWDVEFKLHAPYRTVVEGAFRNGRLERLNVTPPERRRDVKVMLGVRSAAGT
ncbi:MAG: LamG domain-containing protein [Armatimonadetes bacterium]|nr:LamG domain-containing protein [Armatimonadota bacterium]